MTGALAMASGVAIFFGLTIPWLNPFTFGPTPAVLPWLVCAASAVYVWLMCQKLTVRLISTAWLAAAVVSSVFALLQFFGQTDAFSPWVNSAQIGEAYGNLRQRNQFATLTSIGLLALTWLFAQTKERSIQIDSPGVVVIGDQLRRLCWGSMLVILAMGNAASGSRTGLVQWLAVGATTLLWRGEGQWRAPAMALTALTGYGACAMALPWLLNTLTGVQSEGLLARFTDGPGCASRLVLWSNVLHLIAQRPWLGWGWGELDYGHFVTLYPGERFCDILDNAHNLPLHLAVELGVPFAALVCVVGLWLTLLARPWCEKDPTRQIAWGVLLVIGLHSLLEYPLWYGPFQLAAVLSMCILARPLKPNNHGVGVKSIITASLFFAVIIFVAFDYWRTSQLYLPSEQRNHAYRDDTFAKVQDTWFFQNQVRFAELTTTVLTPTNAEHLFNMGQKLVHFSPEPRVVEKLVESALMLGHSGDADYWLTRYRAAFPEPYLRWVTETVGEKRP